MVGRLSDRCSELCSGCGDMRKARKFGGMTGVYDNHGVYCLLYMTGFVLSLSRKHEVSMT